MKYRMDDGIVVDTDNATDSWEEDTRWNGNNHISLATGSQWEHETLYRSAKGRYYIVSTSQRQGSSPSATWVTAQEAAAWIVAQSGELPADLLAAAEEVTE